MAAMSLRFTAISFQPRSGQGVVWRVKWVPSTSVSVSAHLNSPAHAPRGRVVAGMPRRSRKSAAEGAVSLASATMRASRSMRPNSPSSRTVLMAPLSPASAAPVQCEAVGAGGSSPISAKVGARRLL